MHPLEAHELEVKLFVEDAAQPGLRAFVPVFHRWIQDDWIPDHLLIDVADYAHVHHGPGVLLVGHEAYYSLDRDEGRLGLAYRRRRGLPEDDASSRLRSVFRATLGACRLLEDEPALSELRFRTDEVRLRIKNRLLAPNEERTFASVTTALEPFLRWLYGDDAGVRISALPVSKEPFGVLIEARAAPPLDVLLSRLKSGVDDR